MAAARSIHSRPSKNQGGFVLVATLWLLVIVVIAAGYFAHWTSNAVEVALARQDASQADLDARSTLETLMYAAATKPMNVGGLNLGGGGTLERPDVPVWVDDMGQLDGGLLVLGNEVRLDGRPYRGLGDTLFAIQDEGGLLSVNSAINARLARLLGVFGVPPEQQPPLIDKLRDYADADDVRHLNGAEEPHYRRLGLPPPPNRPLLTAGEIYRVMDWDGRPELRQGRGWAAVTTVAPVVTLNFNTAPAEVLMIVPGMTEEGARRILEWRRRQSFMHPGHAFAVAGLVDVGDGGGYETFPSAYWHVTFWQLGAGRGWRFHIQLTPVGDQPWLVHQAYPVSVSEQSEHEVEPVESPLFATPLSAAGG